MEKQCCTCVPVNEEELYPQIEEFINQHRGDKNALIMVLHKARVFWATCRAGYRKWRQKDLMSP